MFDPEWNPKTKSWIRHNTLRSKDNACPRCIGGTMLRDQLGNESCLLCGHITKLVLPRRGASRDMNKKPNSPERPGRLEEQLA